MVAKMARLYKTSSDGAVLVVDQLAIAESFWQRGRGLLGRSRLEANEALWIKPCNNIHTFFMKFAIDCVFVDSKMEIKSIAKSVVPFRFVGPYWKSSSVIEMPSGLAEMKNLKIGDQLYVVN
jgi:uncharacterized protein